MGLKPSPNAVPANKTTNSKIEAARTFMEMESFEYESILFLLDRGDPCAVAIDIFLKSSPLRFQSIG
jgi:hypothetical protein